ncbi:hypothetical protein D3C86_1922970 [compost metagenome]
MPVPVELCHRLVLEVDQQSVLWTDGIAGPGVPDQGAWCGSVQSASGAGVDGIHSVVPGAGYDCRRVAVLQAYLLRDDVYHGGQCFQ